MRSKVLQEILDETPEDVKIFVDWYADIVVRVNQLLEEKRITREELAKKLNKHPSEISKWLSGEHNFTLRSLAKLQAELEETILYIPRKKAKKANTEFTPVFSKSVSSSVARTLIVRVTRKYQYHKEIKIADGTEEIRP